MSKGRPMLANFEHYVKSPKLCFHCVEAAWCYCRYDRGTGDQWDEEHNNVDHNSEFGFVTMEKPHTLRSFAAYADWMKALHFSEPRPKAWPCSPQNELLFAVRL